VITSYDKTLRLVCPQWQGGNNAPYNFGSQLLTWLAPAPVGPVEHVQVSKPDGEAPPLENGITRSLRRSRCESSSHRASRDADDQNAPERLEAAETYETLLDAATFARRQ
jgi:arginase